MIHARVYGLADYYDMSELRDHACGCFVNLTDDELEEADLEGFKNVAREVCRTTTREDGSDGGSFDSPLRSAFLSLVALYAPKLASNANFAAALCEPNSHEIRTDIFCVLARRMAELQTERDVNTATLEAEKEALQNSMATTKSDADDQISAARYGQQVAEEKLQHNEGVVQRFIRSLRNLPVFCGNQNCSNEFGSLRFERNGDRDWQVRCGARKCTCKLN